MKVVPAGNLTEMVGAYMHEQTGMVLQPGMYVAFIIATDQDEMAGAVVISNFRGTDCEISCAADPNAKVWRPHIMRAVFDYVFNVTGCVRCTSITTKRNKRTRDFLEGLGFALEGNLRLGYDGRVDALIYGLLASECRYLAADSEDDHGQEIRADSAPAAGPDAYGASADRAEPGGGSIASEPEPHQSGDAAGESDV